MIFTMFQVSNHMLTTKIRFLSLEFFFWNQQRNVIFFFTFYKKCVCKIRKRETSGVQCLHTCSSLYACTRIKISQVLLLSLLTIPLMTVLQIVYLIAESWLADSLHMHGKCRWHVYLFVEIFHSYLISTWFSDYSWNTHKFS